MLRISKMLKKSLSMTNGALLSSLLIILCLLNVIKSHCPDYM